MNKLFLCYEKKSGILCLQGKDVLAFLHRVSTNDVKKLAAMSYIRTCFTNEKGRILDTTSLLNLMELQLLICSIDYREKLKSWLEKFVILEKVKINIDNDYTTWECFVEPNRFAKTLLQQQNMEFGKIYPLQPASTYAYIQQVCKTSVSVCIIAKNSQKEAIVALLNKAEVEWIDEDYYQNYRITQGIPVAPNEINENYNPHEVDLLTEVSFNKGCYIGQEVIARLDTYDKVKQYLRGIIFSEEVFVKAPLPIFAEEQVGEVTSVAHAVKSNQYVGMGFIHKKFFDTPLYIVVNGKKIAIVVTNFPIKL